jgi:rhodanese-related sulfurtransferase
VTAALPEIELEELRRRMQGGDALVVVDALSPLSYAAAHLPGAVNIPPRSPDSTVERRIPDRDTPVVVYCQNVNCDSSVEVAERLVELGYRNVLHFAGGKDAWRDAGLPLEGGRV